MIEGRLEGELLGDGRKVKGELLVDGRKIGRGAARCPEEDWKGSC